MTAGAAGSWCGFAASAIPGTFFCASSSPHRGGATAHLALARALHAHVSRDSQVTFNICHVSGGFAGAGTAPPIISKS